MLHWSYLVEKEWLQQCDSEVNHGVITTSRYMYQTTQTTTLQKEAASDVEQKCFIFANIFHQLFRDHKKQSK